MAISISNTATRNRSGDKSRRNPSPARNPAKMTPVPSAERISASVVNNPIPPYQI